jgi:hypothetical protein
MVARLSVCIVCTAAISVAACSSGAEPRPVQAAAPVSAAPNGMLEVAAVTVAVAPSAAAPVSGTLEVAAITLSVAPSSVAIGTTSHVAHSGYEPPSVVQGAGGRKPGQ